MGEGIESKLNKTVVNPPPADAEGMPQKGDLVKVHYTGTLNSNGEKFDSSRDRGKPFEFELGVGKVIQGWDKGVATMKKGERAKFTIPSDMAYGDAGAGDKIPPKSDLDFDIELLDFGPKPKEKWELTEEEKLGEAKTNKEKGNESFKEQKYEEAIQHYNEALSYFENSEHWEEALFSEKQAIEKSCYLNLSQCLLKVKSWMEAAQAATNALNIDDSNPKAYFRRALACMEIEEFDQAKWDLTEAAKLDKTNKEIRTQYDKLKVLINNHKKKEKASFGNLFAKSMYSEKQDVWVPVEHKLSELPKVFFDLKFGEEEELHRIVLALYSDSVPKTAENFRQLCVGAKQKALDSDEMKPQMCHTKPDIPLHFKGSSFHRVIPNFMMQGGDFTNGDGTGGESIYGPQFNDERFVDKHTRPFLLSMANCGPNTNGSQFFLTFKDTPHLDGKHVVFGEVISGYDVVRKVEQAEIGQNDKPIIDIKIQDCGELSTDTPIIECPKEFLRGMDQESDPEDLGAGTIGAGFDEQL